MPNTSQCANLEDYLVGEQCTENFAGMSETVYVFERNKLNAGALTASNETYTMSAKPFKTGGRLYKFECKRESQQIQGESQGQRRGFVVTHNFVLEAVDAATARIARALNNLDLGYIMVGSGGEIQILYDPYRKCQIESGGLTTDTGVAASDDRQTSVAVKLGPISYPNLFLNADAVEGGLDSLMAPAA